VSVTRPRAGAPWPTSSTRLLALLGWPARHSVSPAMHNAALREQRLDLVYVALPTPPDALADAVRGLGAVGAVGANVTVPHKQAVVDLCDHLTPEAELVGAVNTLAWTTDGLLGDNTDATGLREAVTADADIRADDRVVVFGTGGAARAAVVAFGRLRCRVEVVGRREEAASEVADLAARAGATASTAVALADTQAVARSVGAARLVCNATPLGMAGEHLPEPFGRLDRGQVAYDLVYTPPVTPFLATVRDRGAEVHNGLGMLVAQAAASYERWTGQQAPAATMSAAAVGALSTANAQRSS
jgi:shikimate dehydrogenase